MPHVVGRDEQLAAFERPVRRYEVEDAARVGDYLAAAGEQAEVGVYLRRRFVEVARADVGVAARAAALAPLDEYQLAVDLEPRDAVDDAHARALEYVRVFYVLPLVEARQQLHDDGDVLAVLRRASSAPQCGRV